MSRILITGGYGFLGSAIGEKLVDEGHNLTLIDVAFNETKPGYYTRLNENTSVRKIQADVRNLDEIIDHFNEVEYCIHCAAALGVNEVITNPKETLNINIRGTENVIKAFNDRGSPKRFVFFSTSEIFGENAFRVTEDGDVFFRNINHPRWSYAISKLIGEHITLGYNRSDKLPVSIVRPFNIYGPKRLGDHAVKSFILNALKNEPMIVYSDGSQIRSWCYVDDFARAVRNLLFIPQAEGSIFNIGNPAGTITIHSLAKLIKRLTNSESEIIFMKPNIIDIDIRVPDIEKSRRILNFEPEISIEEGISNTIDWYKLWTKK